MLKTVIFVLATGFAAGSIPHAYAAESEVQSDAKAASDEHRDIREENLDNHRDQREVRREKRDRNQNTRDARRDRRTGEMTRS